ncbi:Nucleosome assembly protein [Tetrabaena socialis]|uniref:Nucleosome assembly protein n=1 Tax=Tetrabaena socialis TaxID=47790 RepID=A0A2J8A499_9CHLO|nr:Nucleosome assembly protein [Tetrabaena socialis]|eukprot:PNH07335.1 Nucleosome assembly protein [Tetrabaena socialis]
MALALLARSLGASCRHAVRPAKADFCRPTVAAQRFLGITAAAGPKGKQPPPPPAPVEVEPAEDEDMYDPTEDLTVPQRRRVLAMKEVQKQYDVVQRLYQAELAQLQHQYNLKYAPLYDERRDIYSGKKAIEGKFDLEDDGEPDEPIGDFWLNALSNHNKIGSFISERDSEVLRYLEDLRWEVLVGEERGFKLTFLFKADNPYFTNSVLEKVYVLEAEDDVVPKHFTGTVISWKEGRNVTVEEQKRRVKGAKGEKSKPAFVVEQVPCDSFFTIFDPPAVPTEENANTMTEEELEEIEEALSNDFEIGFAIKDQVIPRAVQWFTGEIAPIGDEEYDDEFEEGGNY